MATLQKIVSGGQTGVDRGALDAALNRGFACGGYCPRGRIAEDGTIPENYPLAELDYGSYAERTLKNVLESDATAIIYFGLLEGGTEQTAKNCIQHQKPYILIDASIVDAALAAKMIEKFVTSHFVRVLNVAGPRASKSPGAHEYSLKVVTSLLQALA